MRQDKLAMFMRTSTNKTKTTRKQLTLEMIPYGKSANNVTF
jgi:hypothetical protein